MLAIILEEYAPLYAIYFGGSPGALDANGNPIQTCLMFHRTDDERMVAITLKGDELEVRDFIEETHTQRMHTATFVISDPDFQERLDAHLREFLAPGARDGTRRL